jgi:hypothetical protein
MKSIDSRRTLLLGFVGLFFLMLLLPLPAQAGAASESKEIGWFFLVVGLLGGLSLFLYGMERMSDALKNVAGEKMKDILGILSNNRIMGLITGAIVTAVIQSSSVTTVMLVGFVSAGLMSLSQTVGVILGADIGTTITAQIVAFKVTKYALLLLAIGFGMLFISKREKIQQYGYMVMGLGMLFFGMGVMKDAMEPLRTYQPFIDLMANMSNPILGILVAAVFTALVQSSSASMGVVIVLAMLPGTWCQYRNVCDGRFGLAWKTARGGPGSGVSCAIQDNWRADNVTSYWAFCKVCRSHLPLPGRRTDRHASRCLGAAAPGGQCSHIVQYRDRGSFSSICHLFCPIRFLVGAR